MSARPDPATDALARAFASDNYAGAHPDVVAALLEANIGHAVSYGDDPWTAQFASTVGALFGEDAVAFPVLTGTAANVLAFDALTRSYEAVVCTPTAHIAVDECGAPERIAGVKLITLPSSDGKLGPEQLDRLAARRGDEHAVQPRLVSISNATELGTVYDPAEVAALTAAAHDRDLLVHVDGARLANAAAAAGVSLGELTGAAGVDVISLGATKNGALAAEAVVFLRPGLAANFGFIRKQGMQLASKMRFVSAQLEAVYGSDLWLRNATHSNEMATRLAGAIAAIDGVEIIHPVQSNAVFAALERGAVGRLRASLSQTNPFYVWEERGTHQVLRWMCSWDTTADDVDAFAAAVAYSCSSVPG